MAQKEEKMMAIPADWPLFVAYTSICKSRVEMPKKKVGGIHKIRASGALFARSCPAPLKHQPRSFGADAPGARLTRPADAAILWIDYGKSF
jgi:hypothetical protein